MPIDSAVSDERGRLLRGALAGTAIALAAVGLCAVAATQALAVGPTYAPKAVAGFAVVAALIVATLPGHHPFARFGWANNVTLARAALVALLAALLGEGEAPRIMAFA